MPLWSSRTPVLSLLAFLLATTLAALGQNAPEHKLTFNIGGGVTPVVGELHNRLNLGGHVTGGVGVNLSRRFSVIGEYMFTALGVDRSVLNQVGAPDGNARMHSVTINPRVSFGGDGRADGYIIGGVGWYRRTVEFTQPVPFVATVFDPWWGFLNVPTVGNQVLASFTRDAFGGNLGLGTDIRLGSGRTKLYAEARYHYANTARRATQIIPVTIGLRF